MGSILSGPGADFKQRNIHLLSNSFEQGDDLVPGDLRSFLGMIIYE